MEIIHRDTNYLDGEVPDAGEELGPSGPGQVPRQDVRRHDREGEQLAQGLLANLQTDIVIIQI